MAKSLKEKVEDLILQKKVEKKETKVEAPVVDKMNPGFDPDVPENKQRWLR